MAKISRFIDGNNFYFGLKKVYGNSKDLINFNFEKFCNFLAGERDIINVFYYNAPLDRTRDLEKYKSQQRFFEMIKKIPKFNLILCRLVKRKLKKSGEIYYTIKEDDIHMAVDMLEGAFENLFDISIIVSGDGDFAPVVKAVRKRGKKVENAYLKQNSSYNLKQNCDDSIRLNKQILDNFFEK